MLSAKAWQRHADAAGLTTGNCRWQQMQGDYVKQNGATKYKTGQIYDLSKRIFNYLNRDLDCMDSFSRTIGENCDYQHGDLQTLTVLQNLHIWGKLVANSLLVSYPKSLLATLFIQGCRFLVPWLGWLLWAFDPKHIRAYLSIDCCCHHYLGHGLGSRIVIYAT